MAYEYITKYDARNFDKGRGGNKIQYIVIHHWDNPSRRPSFQGVINWFCYSRDCSTSAHYVVEGGKVACLVDEKDTAWHAGSYWYNQRSLGIECSPYCTKKDLETIGELVAGMLDYHGNLTILAHKDIVGTSCPGSYYPPSKVLAPYIAKYRGKSQYNKGSKVSTNKPTIHSSSANIAVVKPAVESKPILVTQPMTSNKKALAMKLLGSAIILRKGDRGEQVKAVQELLRVAGYTVDCDGIFGTDTETKVRQFQRANKLEVDGIVGAGTISYLIL